MSGQGDFGLDNLAYQTNKVETGDFNRLSQIVAANNKKINQNVKEIQRLCKTIGTEFEDADSREQL
jgi:hypothetical protein